nr:CarD family transcriptional regulator [uncultured Cellulosilyticum sp.]
MFNVGDYMICGANGVCKVEEVGPLEVSGIEKETMYYTLRPVYASESTVFTPVDNEKIIMRPILTKEEARALVDEIPDIEIFVVDDDKKKEILYKEALRSCDCKQLVRIIKTTYLNQKARLAAGKKAIMGDKKYFQMAEEHLYNELAIALGMDKSEVKAFIVNRVKQLAKEAVSTI